MALQKVAQFKECTIEYVAPAGGTFEFWTDMLNGTLPSGTMVKKISQALPPTGVGVCTTTTVPLVDGSGAPLEGTLFYPRFIPPVNNIMQVRAAVVKLRAVGVYLNGALNETWETLPIGIGV